MRRGGHDRTTPGPPRRRPDGTHGDPRDNEPSRSTQGQVRFAVSPVRPPVADRGLSIAAGVVALVIGLAVLKPWAAVTSDPPVVVPPPVAVATPAATSSAARTPRPTDSSPEGLAAPVCLGASGWRVASLETWQEQDVRVWRAIEPIAVATGPLDPAISTVPVVGTDVGALGWCAPAYGPERPAGPAAVTGWIVMDGVAHDLELRRVLPAHGTTHLAALYVPIAACGLGATCGARETRPVPQQWAAGRVVFRYDDRGTAATAWFGVDVALYSRGVPGNPAIPDPTPAR